MELTGIILVVAFFCTPSFKCSHFNQHWCSHAACYDNEHGHCSGYHYYCPAYGRWS